MSKPYRPLSELPTELQASLGYLGDNIGGFGSYLHAVFGPEPPRRVDTLSYGLPSGALQTELGGLEARGPFLALLPPDQAAQLLTIRRWLSAIPDLFAGTHITTPRLERTMRSPEARVSQFSHLAELATRGRVQLFEGEIPIDLRNRNSVFVTDATGGVGHHEDVATYREILPERWLQADPSQPGGHRWDEPHSTYAHNLYAQWKSIRDASWSSADTAAHYDELAQASRTLL